MIGVLMFNFQIGNIDTKKNYSAARYHYSLDWHPCNTFLLHYALRTQPAHVLVNRDRANMVRIQN